MRIIIATLLIAGTIATFGQNGESIITDRPTQSASAFVAPQGNLLLELGFLGERVSTGITNTTFLNALVRFGVVDGVELRLTQNYLGNREAGEKNFGLSPLTIGTKIHIMNEDGPRPQMSVLGQVTLDNGDNAFRGGTISEIRLNFQNTLDDNLSLGYNIGLNDGDNLFYTIVLGLTITDGLSAFVEPYGFFNDEFDQRFNAGLIYLYKPNIQFDISFGAGVNDIAPDSFFGFGAAFGF